MNKKIILPILVILMILTSIAIFRLGERSEKANNQGKIDSLKSFIIQRDKQIEVLNYKLLNIDKSDSIEIIKYKERTKKDSILIIKQARQLFRYKGLNNSQLLDAIDSAYEANH